MLSRRDFERIVDRVLDELEEWVVDRLDNLIIVVEDRPTLDQDPDGEGLLGLYDGVPLPERSGDYWGVTPDQITVYRLPHLELGLDRPELEEEIRRTVLHEIAHHIGIEDDRLHELGWD